MAESNPLAATDVEAGTNDEAATRPKVLIIVQPREAPVPTPRVVKDKVSVPEIADDETTRFKGPIVRREDLIEVEDQPTERIQLKKRTRTDQDEQLVAAVVQLDLDADPSPLTDFLGRTLLERTARAAHLAGAPRFVMVSRGMAEEDRTRVFEQAHAGFCGGTVELVSSDLDEKNLGRGRVLLLDCSALHDGEAIERLASTRGEQTSLLLGQYGDGLRVLLEEGAVAQVGKELSPYSGNLTGACSTPVEDFERITQVGQSSALDQLSREKLLIADLNTDTFSRQFRDGGRIEAAQRDCYDALASSGNDGLFDDLFGRPVARFLTLKLLHQSLISPSAISMTAGILGVLAAALLATGQAGLGVAAGLLLVVSAILDRSDGELARLRMEDTRKDLDFYLDHVTHALVMLGLGWGVQSTGSWEATTGKLPALGPWLAANDVSALIVSFAAAAGVLALLAVMLWRGAPSPKSIGLRRMGDALATSFGSRDYFYLLIIAALVNMVIPDVGIMGFFLVISVVLVYVFWAALLVLNVAAPRRA